MSDVFCAEIITPGFHSSGASDSEQVLVKKLFSSYNLKVRPARSPEERVVVRVGMVLSSFVGLVRHTRTHAHTSKHSTTFYKIHTVAEQNQIEMVI